MRRAATALLLLALHAGCLGAAAPQAPLVVVEDALAFSGQGRTSGAFGPHCANVTLDEQAPAVDLTRPGGEAPDALLVRRYHGWRGGSVASFSSDGVEAFPLPEENVTLRSPIRDGPPLLDLRREGRDVLVEGTRLAPGDEGTWRFSYPVEGDSGGWLHVNETLRVRNLGPARLTVGEPPGLCL